MIINNVKLVLDDEVVHGSLEVHDGRILAFAESQSRLSQALDGEGGWLLPGLIELHTDNLDKFFTPRPKVDWPAHSAMSSHDDATEAHVAESHQLGSVIAEFPTTLAAAQASRQHGMHVLMGAPNIVRGGSHSGNVAAHQLASHGLLDILSSDYYPASLLDAAFRIADAEDNAFTLPQAIRLVSQHPAQALGLDDRGVIAEGKRADLVLAHRRGEHIQIDHVWRQGKRVF